MEKIVEEIKALRDEMYNKCIEGLKMFMKERGVQKNCFIETLSFDISDFEIEISNQSTIDEITYIPSKDVLGFVVYKYDNPNEVFMCGEFKRGDADESVIADYAYDCSDEQLGMHNMLIITQYLIKKGII